MSVRRLGGIDKNAGSVWRIGEKGLILQAERNI